jgi:hypothetical protein
VASRLARVVNGRRRRIGGRLHEIKNRPLKSASARRIIEREHIRKGGRDQKYTVRPAGTCTASIQSQQKRVGHALGALASLA